MKHKKRLMIAAVIILILIILIYFGESGDTLLVPFGGNADLR